MLAQVSVVALFSSAMIGVPWPKNITGIRIVRDFGTMLTAEEVE